MTLDRIFDKLRQWGKPWVAGREPVEIHRALLEDIEAQVVAVGGGRRVLPCDRVEVRLLAATPEEAIRLEAIVQSGWELEREIKERLKAKGVRVPEAFAVTVEVTQERSPDFGERHYAVAFSKMSPGTATSGATEANPAPAPVQARAGTRAPDESRAGTRAPDESRAETREGTRAPADPPELAPVLAEPAEHREAPPVPAQRRAGRPVLHLSVLKGKAVRDSYELSAERIYLGRLEEVLDAAGRVKRRNDVAFLEEGDLSQTVSREHARIAWDPDTGSFWLRDEGSASGTMLFRAGRAIEVSRHDRRGVRLENGDEVYLGRAVVKVAL
jgi:hypothetical protein